MPVLEAVKDLADLESRFSRLEIMQRVRARHPDAPPSDFVLFQMTYAEYHQVPIDQFTDQVKSRVSQEYLGFCGDGDIPVYFARCLLPT